LTKPMVTHQHFWVTTAPRTGSMWTYNAVRAVGRVSGKTVLPDEVPQDDNEFIGIYQNAIQRSPDPKSIYAYKVHTPLNKSLAGSKFITTIRDPREVAVSYMRFMNVDFENGFAAARTLSIICEAFELQEPANALLIHYRDIVQKPEKVILRLAKFMDLKLDNKSVEGISKKLSAKEVRKQIEGVDQRLNEQLTKTGDVQANEIVRIDEGNYRLFDVKTGFQTGHVSGMKQEEYRARLTPQQVAEMNDYFGDWLTKYGFSKEF
jgi:hypothetical protein